MITCNMIYEIFGEFPFILFNYLEQIKLYGTLLIFTNGLFKIR